MTAGEEHGKKAGTVRVPFEDRLYALIQLKLEQNVEEGGVVKLKANGGETRWSGKRRGEYKLGAWVARMRSERKRGMLEQAQNDQLTAAGMPWTSTSRPASSGTVLDGDRENDPLDDKGDTCACYEEHCAICAAHIDTIPDGDDADRVRMTNVSLLSEVKAKRKEAKARRSGKRVKSLWSLEKFYIKYVDGIRKRNQRNRLRGLISLSTLKRYRKIAKEKCSEAPNFTFGDIPRPGAPPVLGHIEEWIFNWILSQNNKTRPPTEAEVMEVARAVALARGIPETKFTGSRRW